MLSFSLFRRQISILADQIAFCSSNIRRRSSSASDTNRRHPDEVVRPLILGIETSCDDTGAALVDGAGHVWGECLHSQQDTHLRCVNHITFLDKHPIIIILPTRFGGIIPPVAQDLHRQHIERVVQSAFSASQRYTCADVDAIAVTNRPGLSLSLLVGLRYAKHLARTHGKPLIPVHHMEAHATMVRLGQPHVRFPYLCLLASGGHCLLTFVRSPLDFRLLGESLDDAPGEAFDKISRRLRLRLMPEFEWLSGGQAIEIAARRATDPERFTFPLPLARQRNCQFSFAGIKNNARRHIELCERDLHLQADTVMPHYADFCAGLLRAITRHICHRTQRAIEYCDLRQPDGWWTDAEGREQQRRLVFSGGVACNDFIFNALSELCAQFGYECVRPERRHCTDNGLMIGWNGVELWQRSRVVGVDGIDEIGTHPKCVLGSSAVLEVEEASIACKWAKLAAYQHQRMEQQSG